MDLLRLGVIQTLAIGGAALSLAIGLALVLPQSDPARALAGVLPLPEVHWQNAETALIAAPSDAATAAALIEANADVAAAPNRLQPYMQRAFIRVRAAHGVLTPDALADFARTYDLAPADDSTAIWRERFAYSHWPELTTPLRIAVMREHVLIWNGRRDDFAALGADIHNGAGRLAYRLTQEEAEAAFWTRYAKTKAKGR